MKFTHSIVVAALALEATAKPNPQTPPPGQTYSWNVGQPVDTDSGWVIGHPAAIDPTVSEYLGIPYAKAPVGPLRWQAPQKAAYNWTPLQATRFGADCPQVNTAGRSLLRNLTDIQRGVLTNLAGGSSMAEDCLKINVWSKPQTGEKKKAVLLWVYGGGFVTGSAASASYNGARFAADQDVVVVSIGYRVGLMGFPSVPELFNDVNLGLLDQRLAVEWVRDNVELFGGDSERITIFGQSAGGRAVDIYSFAWVNATDPVVNGFIPMSGAAPQTTGYKPNPKGWFELSRRLGCGGEEKGKTTVACLQGKKLDEVLGAIPTDRTNRTDLSRAFSPVTDGKTYFDNYDWRRQAGQTVQVVCILKVQTHKC